MLKYGIENFTFEVLEEIDISDNHSIQAREQFWIEHFNTIIPNGYNITFGGPSLFGELNPFYNKTHSDETKKKISEKNKNRIVSEEEREMRRRINKGERNPFYNKKHSKETIEKIKETNIKNGSYEKSSQRMKGNKLNELIKRKKVAMIDLKTDETLHIFNNAMEAGKYLAELGLTKAKHPSNVVTSVCNGHEKSGGGYFWKYIEENEE